MKIAIHLTPGAQKSEVVGSTQDIFGRDVLSVRVAARPVDGAANEALIELLAGYFDTPRSTISIISGHISRHKVVQINK